MKILIEKNSLFKHIPWFYHPENPGRVKIIMNALSKTSFRDHVLYVEKSADLSDVLSILERIHCRKYIEFVLDRASKAPCELDPDTYLSRDSLELLVETISLVYETASSLGSNDTVFLIIRPPGHHAGKYGKAFRAPTLGFCIFNNAAIAVEALRDNGFNRIVVLDFDIHHGNGTQEIYYKDPTVLHVDLHRNPIDFYPFTGFPEQIGSGRGRGYSVNFILEPKSGDDSYLFMLNLVSEIIELYSPEAIVVSAGFDGFLDDGLADTMLTEHTYYNIGKLLRKLNLPTLLVLEGGYSIGLERGIPALVYGILGIKKEYEPSRTEKIIYKQNIRYAKKLYNHILKYLKRRG